jgi:hypothetical protein
MMNCKGCEIKRPWPNLRYYPGIGLERLRKTMKASVTIPGLRPRVEPGTSQIRRGVNDSTVTFSVIMKCCEV